MLAHFAFYLLGFFCGAFVMAMMAMLARESLRDELLQQHRLVRENAKFQEYAQRFGEMECAESLEARLN